MPKFLSGIDLSSTKVVAQADPTADTDGATQNYVKSGRLFVPSLRPTAALAETLDRMSATLADSPTTLQNSVLRLTAIWLPKGLAVASITFVSGATPLAVGTHGWAALYDSSLALLRQSADDTAIAWAASTAKTFTLQSSGYTTTYAGLHYLGLCATATTRPSLLGVAASAFVNALAPSVGGQSTGSLTSTAPNPAAGITTVGAILYGYVS